MFFFLRVEVEKGVAFRRHSAELRIKQCRPAKLSPGWCHGHNARLPRGRGARAREHQLPRARHAKPRPPAGSRWRAPAPRAALSSSRHDSSCAPSGASTRRCTKRAPEGRRDAVVAYAGRRPRRAERSQVFRRPPNDAAEADIRKAPDRQRSGHRCGERCQGRRDLALGARKTSAARARTRGRPRRENPRVRATGCSAPWARGAWARSWRSWRPRQYHQPALTADKPAGRGLLHAPFPLFSVGRGAPASAQPSRRGRATRVAGHTVHNSQLKRQPRRAQRGSRLASRPLVACDGLSAHRAAQEAARVKTQLSIGAFPPPASAPRTTHEFLRRLPHWTWGIGPSTCLLHVHRPGSTLAHLARRSLCMFR